MTNIAIALGMVVLWGLGLALAGAYWVKREKRSLARLPSSIEDAPGSQYSGVAVSSTRR